MEMSQTRLKRLGQAGALALILIAITAAFSNVRPISEHYSGRGNLLGNYLAGRIARGQRDISTAADFYGKALSADPKNAVILEQTFLLEVAAANWPRAVDLAKDLTKVEPKNRLARLVLGVRDFKRGAYASAEKQFGEADKEPISDLTKLLAQAWAKLAQNNPSGAYRLLDKSDLPDWTLQHRRYHKALIAGVANQPKIAGKAYAQAFQKNPRAGRLAAAYASHAVHAGNRDLARDVLNTHLDRVPQSVHGRALLKKIEAGETPELVVTTPTQGIAEVFYGIGDALAGDDGFEIATIYLQIALYLNPGSTLAKVSLGDIFQMGDKHELAVETYRGVPEDSPFWLESQVKTAYSLNALERVEEARKLLDRLAEKTPDDSRPLKALGEILSAHKRFEEATPYYDRAIAMVKKPQKQHASLYYARGICYERTDQWPLAEADFKKSLELFPEQPAVLNYLGYTWIDKGLHLQEALDLIRKAAKLDPNAGYIVDSLGWAQYRLGNYAEAVEHLERATELRPDDAVINDHLGDAYWRVGRRFEARYQWSQALTFEPEPEDEKKIKRKLAEGLEEPRQIKAQAATPEANVKKDN